ncbi:hypothetical protein PAAG_08286 [Paracoccidioides lutzii Pb01]|uniref:Uncharacterized protein n=1 Tax=Paracoccidioides lutzii (strain ATCC MYA-826 / Pb01) TaxID=502779 RepID=C1HBZ5_PARBA|nr:hypothetical protein PAAG_08286 [Paracoccidioides lutzii Pb01]EEH38559.1 hypothetical protein PAAG_08286 [Paracoccidioides lutzii Pb01]
MSSPPNRSMNPTPASYGEWKGDNYCCEGQRMNCVKRSSRSLFVSASAFECFVYCASKHRRSTLDLSNASYHCCAAFPMQAMESLQWGKNGTVYLQIEEARTSRKITQHI